MSRVASDFVLAQEKYLTALERALGSAVEVVVHNQSCRHCRVFGNRCHQAGLLTRQMYIDKSEAERLKEECEVLQNRLSERAYNLLAHIAQDKDSVYGGMANEILDDERKDG